MIIELILFLLLALIAIILLYIEHRTKKKNTERLYNNLKKMKDADRL